MMNVGKHIVESKRRNFKNKESMLKMLKLLGTDKEFTKAMSNKIQLEILKNNNFKVFFYNDFSNKLEIKNNSIFMTKKFVSGHTLRHNQDDFKELFDCKTVYDHNQRNTVYPSS